MTGAAESPIAAGLARVRARIARAAEAAGRDPASVRLIAVGKLQPVESLRAALDAGQQALGENYAQELRDKADALAAHEPAPEWHFLGALQTNKVKYVVGRAALVHTCDRLALAEELSRRAAAKGLVQRVLVEVNLGREPQKGGVAPEALPELLRALADLPGLRCEGLMCIPPAAGEPRSHFAALRELRDAVRARAPSSVQLGELSMGMSADFEAAIAEGATLARVGTAIFGERPRKG
jgi:pyridoxal phosphate enzyme (YggS family)